MMRTTVGFGGTNVEDDDGDPQGSHVVAKDVGLLGLDIGVELGHM